MKDIKFEALNKVAQTKFKFNNLKGISRIDTISPPSVFIGSKLKYPFMNVGILSPIEKQENAWIYDDSKYWAKNNFEIKDVVGLREGLLNSRFVSRAYDSRLNKKFLEIAKEVAIALKPVDVEIGLKNKLTFKKKIDKVVTHSGMRAELNKARITSNVKVDRTVDKMMNDEIKAGEGINILYKKNFDEYSLSKILSVGVLGLKKDKKLVPTRWSITATDDIVTKGVLEEVRKSKWIEDYGLFFGEFLGNCYLIMLFPGVWSYELFELYLPGSSWNPSSEIKASTDFESFEGRKKYASNCAGGYYAARLPIAEHLNSIKRQASVLVIRIETPSYWASLGVWVVRESVRKALERGFMKFDSREELIESVNKIGKIKYNFDCSGILNKSLLLSRLRLQTDLRKWF